MLRRLVVGGFFSVLALLVVECWPMAQQISVSPDSKWIALSVPPELAERSHLWLIERATWEFVTALRDGEAVSWPTWSPNGQELLYVASTGLQSVEGLNNLNNMIAQEWRLMLYSPETGESRQLFEDQESYPWGLSFSPDGQKIAYYRTSAGGKIEIVLFDRRKNQQQVIQVVQAGEQLRYLPYGPSLVWLAGTNDRSPRLVLVRVEEILSSLEQASTVRVVRGRIVRAQLDCYCEEEIAHGYYPLLPTSLFIVASPDGRRLYLNGYPRSFALAPEEPIYLYEIDIEERQALALYEGNGIALAPALSPNGSQLLFTVIENQKSDLYLRSFQALSPAAKITDDGRTGFGFWLTDEEIGFLRSAPGDRPAREIWRKNLITGEEEALTPILARQRRTAQLSVQLAAAQQEAQQYKEELSQTQEMLRELQGQIESLSRSLQQLSAGLQAQSQQTVEALSRQLIDPVQQINSLNRTVSDLKQQTEGLDAKLTELQKRPQFDIWLVVLIVAVGALFVVGILRRSFKTTVQQLAFPPQ
jgi:Tol biopolymer transport system component/uncharacterized protein YukE